MMNTSQEELSRELLSETDKNKLDEIIDIFNLNIRKKDILRANKLSDLQDKISDQIATRIDEKADEFSNKDLLDYFKVIQDIIGKNTTSIDDLKTVGIQINQQNNVSLEIVPNSLNKESRDRVIDAVQSILKKYDYQELPEVEVVEGTEE